MTHGSTSLALETLAGNPIPPSCTVDAFVA